MRAVVALVLAVAVAVGLTLLCADVGNLSRLVTAILAGTLGTLAGAVGGWLANPKPTPPERRRDANGNGSGSVPTR